MGQRTDTEARLKEYLKYLHLPGIRQSYEEIAQMAERESLGYAEYLLELLEREHEIRYNNRIAKLLLESKLPMEKTMNHFDLKRLQPKISHQVKAITAGDFLDRKENVLAFGNPGSGKTHLLCAIGHELVRQGRRILFTTCSLLIQELQIAKKGLQLGKCLKRLSKFEGLIIDDVGYVQREREEMEVFFTLLAERYERGSVLLTSNLPFSKWESIFKDPMVTAAAIDRLVHHSIILELNMESYRMVEAKKSRTAKVTVNQ
jgi:DNA replication protein DnaC